MKTGTLHYRVIEHCGKYTLEIKRKFGFFTNHERVEFDDMKKVEQYLRILETKPTIVKEGTIDMGIQ